MALDPALAGLLGALVGGAATFGGSLFGNRQQARHERKRRAQERKLEAYTNAMRSLMRAAYPEWRQDSQSPGTSSAKETQVSGEAPSRCRLLVDGPHNSLWIEVSRQD